MKTRFTRFVTSFALLFAILAGNITTIFADSGNIATYGMVCSCGKGTYQYSYRDNPPYGETHYDIKCTHHKYGTDFVETRTVTTTYKCNYCGQVRKDKQTQKKVTCKGYDFV